MSFRSEILEQLGAIVPETFEVHQSVTAPQRVQKPTLFLAQDSIQRMPEAPATGLTASFALFLVSQYEDLARAEDELDDLLSELLDTLDGSGNLHWSEASRVALDGRLPAYELTVSSVIIRTPK